MKKRAYIDKVTGEPKAVDIYTDREKMEYHIERSKKGAKAADGSELSEFIRGKHSALAEVYGKKLGQYKLNKAKESGDTEYKKVLDERAEYRERKKQEREEFKQRQVAERAAAKAAKKSGK